MSTFYYFSGLSDRSFCLAESIADQDKQVYFTDLPEDLTGLTHLTSACEKKKYSVTSSDILSCLEQAGNEHPTVILLIHENEERNLSNAIRISEQFGGEKNVSVYVYASTPESEYLIDEINAGNYRRHLNPMKLRRVLPVRREVYHCLSGEPFFETAVDDRGEKWIRVVIAGLKEYGMEMLRAVLWFAQMDGFFLRVDVFDERTDLKEVFTDLCPGIIERGNLPRMGEDYYDLRFHPGTKLLPSVLSAALGLSFAPSVLFVDSGTDADNIDLSIRLRRFYAGQMIENGDYPDHGPVSVQKPQILAVVRDDARAALIDGNSLKNYKGQYFDIRCVGRNSRVYSMERLLFDPVERTAAALHGQSLEPSSFEMHEYYRRSSLASALHQPFRLKYVPDEKKAAVTEHRRWCAYMRSTEGYRYGTVRDDLAGRHPSLAPYADLSRIEQEKDALLNRRVKVGEEPEE